MGVILILLFSILALNKFVLTDISKNRTQKVIENKKKEQLLNLLKIIDKNHDLRIDQFELEIWIINNIKNSDLENSFHKLQAHDIDGNGGVTWSEYLINTHKFDIDHIKEIEDHKPLSDHSKAFLKEIYLNQRKFKLADVDKDGKLTKSEYVHFEYPEHSPFMAPVVIDSILHNFDINLDGLISFEEFHHDINDTEEQNHFNKLDKNKNGQLDKSEIWSWVMPGIENTAKDEVNLLLGNSTTKHSKSLDFQQILSNYDLWIKSPATDFGLQLTTITRLLKDEL